MPKCDHKWHFRFTRTEVLLTVRQKNAAFVDQLTAHVTCFTGGHRETVTVGDRKILY